MEVIRPGRAEGKLIGGNLTLLASLCGTPYLPSFKDALIFLEEVDEEPYRVDRKFVQLLQGSDIAEAAGIIIGRFVDCEPEPGRPTLTLNEVFNSLLKPLGIPVLSGFSFGHIEDQCTFPQGIMAAMDTETFTVQLLENPVS